MSPRADNIRSFLDASLNDLNMELMVVKDVVPTAGGQTLLTGPLLLKEFSRRSEVEQAFGARVTVSSVGGQRVLVPVNGVSVSQAMSGSWQVSVAIDFPGELSDVALESLVTREP
ncbi:hypothetical protein ACS5PN_21920 [Roseateles sp. NT4]|uniref:hypothetical protein n=1 Tax=Roseateles sp. NT4 TaxID=3453715 RepID=UPI003EEE4300